MAVIIRLSNRLATGCYSSQKLKFSLEKMLTKTNHRRLKTGGQHKMEFLMLREVLCPVLSLFLSWVN